MPCAFSARAGSRNPLAVFGLAPNAKLPEGPAVTSFNAAYSTLLPSGPFFGVFVPKGTPDDVLAKLNTAPGSWALRYV